MLYEQTKLHDVWTNWFITDKKIQFYKGIVKNVTLLLIWFILRCRNDCKHMTKQKKKEVNISLI